MPARDGSGPMGQGSRTGRGMGNCNSTKTPPTQTTKNNESQPLGLGGRIWDATIGGFLGRRRRGRTGRK